MQHLLSQMPQHRAEPLLNRLVACGWIGRAEALAAFVDVTARSSPCGRHARLVARQHALTRQPVPETAPRAQAATAIRKAIAPLLANRPSRMALHRAAHDAGARHLTTAEIRAIAAAELARHLRTGRTKSHLYSGEAR